MKTLLNRLGVCASNETHARYIQYRVEIYVIGYGKRAHFAQELIFQNKQLKNVTPLDFVHNSDSLKGYNFSQEDQFFML